MQQVEEVDALTDPCPLPSTLKKRGLNERERLLYAPMADVGGLLYDKDAVYIDIPDWKVRLLASLIFLGCSLYQHFNGNVRLLFSRCSCMDQKHALNMSGLLLAFPDWIECIHISHSCRQQQVDRLYSAAE